MNLPALNSSASADQHPLGNIGVGSPEIGDLLVQYLEKLGVEYVFGVPGGAIEPLYNALARSERHGGPRAIVARHETGAAFIAEGYTRQTGKLGVCCATTGPGATNLITGVASAYENHIPMLVITAQTSLTNFGRGALQESSCTGVNIVSMFQHCTRYNTLVSHVDQFERKLVSAIVAAFQSEAGPAHLSIPLDLLRHPALVSQPSYDLYSLLKRPSLLDSGAVATLSKQIDDAKKVVFVVGEGCGEAIGNIIEVALAIEATIVTTPHAKGLISPYHHLFRGVIGFAGHDSAREALLDSDVDMVIAVGTSLGEWSSNGWDIAALLNNRLIHVDSNEWNFTRSPMARMHVRGRIKTVFEYLLVYIRNNIPNSGMEKKRRKSVSVNSSNTRVQSHERNEPRRYFQLDSESKYMDDSTPIKPQRLMHELTHLFSPNTKYLADSGNSMVWAIHYLHPFDRRMVGTRDIGSGLFCGCLEFASMGWAIGASIGTALACPGNPVVCITGDGSWLMSGQEMTVAIQEQLPVIYIILNDGALGMVKHGQRLAHAEAIGFELPEIDYSEVAKAMGVESFVIRSPQDLRDLDINTICGRPGPTLLDVRIDSEEVPPMAARMKVLGDVA